MHLYNFSKIIIIKNFTKFNINYQLVHFLLKNQFLCERIKYIISIIINVF